MNWPKKTALIFCFFSLIVGVQISHAVEMVTVDQIEFLGAKSVSETELVRTLEINHGDVFDQSKIKKTLENLSSLYYLKGFQSAQFAWVLLNKKPPTLQFQILEGDPVKIRSIKFRKNSEHWDEVGKDIERLIGLTAGNLFDQERLNESRKKIESFLVSKNFFGSKVSEIRSTIVPTEKLVDLEIFVDLGEKIEIGFKGVSRFSYSEVHGWILDQQSLGVTKDFITDVKERVIREYQAVGYFNVTVDVFSLQNRAKNLKSISLVVQEGQRVKVKAIDFDGLLFFRLEELREKYLELAPRLTKNGYYVEAEIEKTASLLVDYMKSRGFLESKLIGVTRSFSNKKNEVQILIYLYEGDRTFVRTIKLEGLSVFTHEEVEKTLGVSPGEALNLFSFNEGVEKLKSQYREKGFLGFRIENENTENVILYSQKNQVADITLFFVEGPQYRASVIEFEGLSKTKEYIARRELRFQGGEILSESKIAESESRLRRLGIFGSVTTRLRDDPDKPGFKQVKIIVDEVSPGVIGGGIGVRNDLGLRLFGEVGYNNLFGKNQSWFFSASANRRFQDFRYVEYQLLMGYVWPWFLLDELTFRPELIQEKRQFINLAAESSNFKANFDKRLIDAFKLDGLFTYSLERIKQSGSANVLDNQTLMIGSVSPGVRVDLRDNALAPTKGFFSILSFDYASAALGSQQDPFPVSYWRSQFRMDQTIPIGNLISWSLSFRTGFEKNLIDPHQLNNGSGDLRVGIPVTKQFSLGGAGSMRGYKLQEINYEGIAQTDVIAQGTLSFVNYRTQVDFPLSDALRAGPFLDAGNLSSNRFRFGNLRYGVGFGVRYITPVGPVNFDWGFKIAPRANEDPYNFYFSIGVL